MKKYLLLLLTPALFAQNVSNNTIIQLETDSVVVATIAGGVVRFNTSTGITSSWDSVTRTFTLTAGAASIASSDLTDGSTIQTSLLPTFERHTCNTTIQASTLVQLSGVEIIPATGTVGVLGVSRASCIGTGTVNIAKFGNQNCIAEGTITAGHIIIPGTSDPTHCKDSGATVNTSVPNTTPVIGRARAAGTDGVAFSVALLGSERFGAQQTTGFTPTAQVVTAGSSSPIVIPYNGTLGAAVLALPSCQDSSGNGFEPGGWTGTTTQMTITFSPSAPATGTCTAVFGGSGGSGGGGSGDFSSNTASSIDGEIVLFSGTAGKTGKRANTSGLAKVTSGVLSAAAVGDIYGLWSGSCSNTTYLRGDGACATPSGSGGDTVSAGTGIAITGTSPKVIALDSAVSRVFISNTASLTFGAISAQACSEQTITVTGAVTGDFVVLMLPSNFTHNVSATGYVSASDTVKVKLCNGTAIAVTPTAAQTYGALIPKTF